MGVVLLVFGLYPSLLLAQLNVDVDIQGLNDQLETNARLYLSIEQQKGHNLINEGRLRRLHQKAAEEIQNALKPYGYYRSKVEGELKKLSDENWQASYRVDPGPAIIVTEFELRLLGEIEHDAEFAQLLESQPVSKGRVLNHLEYENLKSNLSRLASERGYFKARFVQNRVVIDLQKYTAAIVLHFDGGPRHTFGRVQIDQDMLDDDLLQRYIPFEEGVPYDLNKLIDLKQGLNDSDYFSRVEVNPGELSSDSNQIPVNVLLKPRKRNRYTLGLGYGTDTGARAKFGWQIPRYNKRGHRFDTEAEVSELGYSLSARYRVPVLNPRTDQIIYSAGAVNETTDSSESDLRTIGISLNRSRGNWRETISLNYQQEDFEVADDSGSSVLLIPGVNWSRIWGKDFIFAVDGFRFDIGLRGATEELVSDADFVQLEGGIKAIHTLGPRNRLITRGRLGSTWTNTFELLPSSVRFFAGGAQSVRGYSYQSLGPLDADGDVQGGKHLMSGSIELEHSFNSKWAAALFIDAGNAIDSVGDDLEQGAGFGIRWKSPIGAVRFDLASAITKKGEPWRLHINIGPDL